MVQVLLPSGDGEGQEPTQSRVLGLEVPVAQRSQGSPTKQLPSHLVTMKTLPTS